MLHSSQHLLQTAVPTQVNILFLYWSSVDVSNDSYHDGIVANQPTLGLLLELGTELESVTQVIATALHERQSGVL